MSEPLERAQELFAKFEAELRAELPAGADIFDAHTHLGTDIDGMVGRPDELTAIFDRFGISRCFMFCLDEPDRHPGFRAGNDRTLEFAREFKKIQPAPKRTILLIAVTGEEQGLIGSAYYATFPLRGLRGSQPIAQRSQLFPRHPGQQRVGQHPQMVRQPAPPPGQREPDQAERERREPPFGTGQVGI